MESACLVTVLVVWSRTYSRRKRVGQEGTHDPGGSVGTPHHTAGLNKGSIQTTEVMEDSLDIACVVPEAGDTAFRIHCLKRSAYAAVLRAFCAQSDLLSQAKEECLAELRNELKISDIEHREYLVKASTDKHIKSLSDALYRGNISNAEVMKDPLDLACVIPDGGDTAFQIHCLERSAYASILRAFCAQPDLISWTKLLTKLRNELRLSYTEHREVIERVSSNDYIKSLRKFCLANYSCLTKKNPVVHVRAVVPDKIDKAGQVFTSPAQQSPMPTHSMSPARNIGILLGTSRSAEKSPSFDPHAVVPAKKLKSGNGSALACSKCSPCAQQVQLAVSSVLMQSSIDDPLDSKTSPREMKAGSAASSMLQEKHSQSNTGDVPLCVHKDMQASTKRGAEVSRMSGSKSLSVIIYSPGNVNHGSDMIKIHLTSSLLNKVEKLFREEPDPGILETAKSILKAQERHLLDALVELSEVSSAAAYSGSPCQPDEFNQHVDDIEGAEETPPKPASSSSYEEEPASTCRSSTEPRRAGREAVKKARGAQQGREFEPAAKRARRPTAILSGPEWVKCFSRKRKKTTGQVNVRN